MYRGTFVAVFIAVFLICATVSHEIAVLATTTAANATTTVTSFPSTTTVPTTSASTTTTTRPPTTTSTTSTTTTTTTTTRPTTSTTTTRPTTTTTTTRPTTTTTRPSTTTTNMSSTTTATTLSTSTNLPLTSTMTPVSTFSTTIVTLTTVASSTASVMTSSPAPSITSSSTTATTSNETTTSQTSDFATSIVESSTTAPPTTTTVTKTFPPTTNPPNYEGFYLVVDSASLASSVKNQTVIDALQQDLARKFGVLPNQIRVVPTTNSADPSKLTLYFAVDSAAASQKAIDYAWNSVKLDTTVSWMTTTRTELSSLGAPMNSPALVSAETAAQVNGSGNKKLGYCENPAVCAGTVIGGLFVAFALFFALFKYQRRNEDDDDDESSTSPRGRRGKYYTFDGRAKSVFDEKNNNDNDRDGDDAETVGPTLAEELSGMDLGNQTSAKYRAAESDDAHSVDPFADEMTSYFADQGFDGKGSGLLNKKKKRSATNQNLGLTAEEMESV